MARVLASVKGHAAVVERLLTACASNRLAPVLLFAGPSGVGKKMVARGLAQALICEKDSTGCGLCGPCLRIEKGSSESFLVISPTTQQLRAEEAKEVQTFLLLQKIGKARVILIDQAHLMNTTAANSLLKTLEEPPQDTYFFLIAQTTADILPTIRSRSQCVRFGPLPKEVLQDIDGQVSDDWLLEFVEGRADLLESLKTEESQNLFEGALKLLQIAVTKDRLQAYDLIGTLSETRDSSLLICQVWQRFFRKLYQERSMGSENLPVRLEKLRPFLKLSTQDIDQLAQTCFDAEKSLQANSDRLLVFESCWEKFNEVTHGLA